MPSRRVDKDDFAEHVVEVRSFHPLDHVVPFVSKNETVCLTIDDKNSICRIFFLTLLLKPREYLGYQVFRAFVIPVYIGTEVIVRVFLSTRMLFGPKLPPCSCSIFRDKCAFLWTDAVTSKNIFLGTPAFLTIGKGGYRSASSCCEPSSQRSFSRLPALYRT